MELVVLGATRCNPLYSKVTDHDINTGSKLAEGLLRHRWWTKNRLLHAAANKEKGNGKKQKEATPAQQTGELESLEEQSE